MSYPLVTDYDWWESHQRDSMLLVSVSPVLFDKHTSVDRTLCRLLRTNADNKSVLGLEIPLYEDWPDKHLGCVEDISRSQI